MAVIAIHDANDPRVSSYVDLRQSRAAARRALDAGFFIAEGSLVVDRLIQSDYQVKSVLVQEGKENAFLDRLSADIPVYVMATHLISKLVGFDFHRGVLACGFRQPLRSVDDFVDQVGRADRELVAIGLMGISEQENLGSILRSAAALGVKNILLGPRTIDPLSRRVIRVSMATVFKHRFFQLTDPLHDLPTLSQAGVRTLAGTLSLRAIELNSCETKSSKTLLLIGNEARGIDADVLTVVDQQVRIRMHNGVDSLNASVAAAILMHHFTGQLDQ